MAKVELEGGRLTIGPPCATDCCPGVDGAEISLPFCIKLDAAAVACPGAPRTIASPAAFITLSGVGPADSVTQGTFLYVMTDAEITLRITTDDGSGGTTVETPITVPPGLALVRQFPATKPLELLEVKGSGRITYAACGPR